MLTSGNQDRRQQIKKDEQRNEIKRIANNQVLYVLQNSIRLAEPDIGQSIEYDRPKDIRKHNMSQICPNYFISILKLFSLCSVYKKTARQKQEDRHCKHTQLLQNQQNDILDACRLGKSHLTRIPATQVDRMIEDYQEDCQTS